VVSLDYGYGPADEREFAERADDESERAWRVLHGLDEPLTETDYPAPGGRGRTRGRRRELHRRDG
jgi:hypothetical protein